MAEPFKPKIVAFLCNWCCYRAADLAGTARIKYSPNVRIIRVMCSGRVDPTFVLKAFALGADGVMIAGCHPGDCHYIEQNYKTMRRYAMLQLLPRADGHRSRPRCGWSGPRRPKASSWPRRSTSFVADVRKLGPLELAGQLGRKRRAGRGPGRHRQRTRGSDGGPGMSGETKGKLALYWAASCGGCEIAVLAINEKILDVAAAFDIVLWPVRRRRQGPRRREDARRRASTSACSTAASAPASRSTWPSCCGGSRRSWWPSAPAPRRAASPGWPT